MYIYIYYSTLIIGSLKFNTFNNTFIVRTLILVVNTAVEYFSRTITAKNHWSVSNIRGRPGVKKFVKGSFTLLITSRDVAQFIFIRIVRDPRRGSFPFHGPRGFDSLPTKSSSSAEKVRRKDRIIAFGWSSIVDFTRVGFAFTRSEGEAISPLEQLNFTRSIRGLEIL